MTLTPQDIQSKQFHVRFRGFDVEEVDGFLETVSEEFLILIQENKQLKDQVETLEYDIENYQHQEKTFQSAIISAQAIADEMTEKSRIEADGLLTKTSKDIERLKDEANQEINHLQRRIDELKTLQAQVRDDVHNLLNSYLTRLDEDIPIVEEKYQEAAAIKAGAASADEPKAVKGEPEGLEQELAMFREEAAMLSEEMTAIESDTGGEDDLSDLYEKIDLPDDELPPSAGLEETAQPLAASEQLSLEEEPDAVEAFDPSVSAQSSPVPDLDDDMLFSLEDPLDDLEPAIVINDDDEHKE